jgi:hypothetical protein
MQGERMTQPYSPPPVPPYAAPVAQPVQYAGPNIPMYYTSERRGRIVRALLWIIIALDLGGVGVTLYQLGLPPDAFENDDVEVPVAFLITMALWGLLYVGMFIAATVLVCMWMYRAHANLTALGTQDLDYTSGWAAGAWFVPFLNLVRPFRIMKEIWKGSDMSYMGSTAWKVAPSPSIIGWWWAVWLISNFASNVSMRMGMRDDLSVQHAALYIDLFNVPIGLAAAWFLIQITRRIDAMQAHRWVAISQYYAGMYAAPHAQPVGAQ